MLAGAMDRAEVLRQLEENLFNAQKRRGRRSARFDEAIKGIPSGGHRPNNLEIIQAASKEYTLALEAVRNAVRLHTDFLTYGTFQQKPLESERPLAKVQKAG